jgi:virulence factor Mce-like protein
VRRIAAIAVLLAVGLAGALVVARPGEADSPAYWVELDNAFGLAEGADVKVAGVRAGRITRMQVDPSTHRALVEIRIDQRGFGSLRTDAFCETRPQSLIGEYFIDCRPGTASRALEPGARIPVEQTGSTVPVDLVNNIMRRPYRERFTMIVNELGAAFAGRGEDLNETIRRASPALRETDRVLAVLAEERRVIRDLTADADRVMGELSDGRRDVGRWVEEARDTAATSAQRSDGIRAQFRRFPEFLRELRPTMAELGEAADAQVPALANLNREAGRLERFLATLGPFAEASKPALTSLAQAARTGRPAMRAAGPRVRELARFAAQAPEVATNLALVLEDLDDPARAVEPDTRAPNEKGYSGLQAILRYVWAQSQAINIFDGNNYILKVAPFLDNLCAAYTDAKMAKEKERDRCAALLGPNRPGITSPDPTATPDEPSRSRSRDRGGDEAPTDRESDRPASGGGDGPSLPKLPDLPKEKLEDLLDDVLEGKPIPPELAPVLSPRSTGAAADPGLGLLEYLFG